jgi:shikimate kinase
MPKTKRMILARPIVMVGMMGSGKSSVGRRLASRLVLPFFDSDKEIEQAAGCTIAEFFERYGEEEFRAGERRVISRMLEGPPKVISIGGGAFMNAEIREEILAQGIAVWLKVEPDLLLERILRKPDERPMLQRYGDPITSLNRLLEERAPFYALSQITVSSGAQPIDDTVWQVIMALSDYAQNAPAEIPRIRVS